MQTIFQQSFFWTVNQTKSNWTTVFVWNSFLNTASGIFISCFKLISERCKLKTSFKFLLLLLWPGMVEKWDTVPEPKDLWDSWEPWDKFLPAGGPRRSPKTPWDLNLPGIVGILWNVMCENGFSGINFLYSRNCNFSIIKFSQLSWSVLERQSVYVLHINKNTLTEPANCKKTTRHLAHLSLCAKSRKSNDPTSRKWRKTSI